MANKAQQTQAGRYAYHGLDRVLHERARLGIVIALCNGVHADGFTFSELKSACSLTDGNLSRHLQLLEESGIINVSKDFVERRPRTLCRLSASGLGRLQQYRLTLQQVLDDLDSADSLRLGAPPAERAKTPEKQDASAGGADSWIPAWEQ